MIISSTNPFPLLYDVYIDAANPLADASNIPANGAGLSSLIDLGRYRNTFSQASAPIQFTYQHNVINGQNAILMNGVDSYMTCAYDAVKNGYNGSMTLTFAWMTNTTAAGKNNRMFGRLGTLNGFNVGQFENAYVWTDAGIGDYYEAAQLTANVWQVMSFAYETTTPSVNIYKNGAFVNNLVTVGYTPNTNDLILGGFSTSLTNLNWGGYLMIMGWAWKELTADQIILSHKYAMGRMGI